MMKRLVIENALANEGSVTIRIRFTDGTRRSFTNVETLTEDEARSLADLIRKDA